MKTWMKGAALALALAGGAFASSAQAEGTGDCPPEAEPAAQAAPAGRNWSRVWQRGEENLVRVSQSWAANRASLEQFGDRNAATVSQWGSGNNAALTQVGWSNAFSLNQTGEGNSACVVQLGHGLNGELVQDGGDTASFVQTPFGRRDIAPEACLAAHLTGEVVRRAWR